MKSRMTVEKTKYNEVQYVFESTMKYNMFLKYSESQVILK